MRKKTMKQMKPVRKRKRMKQLDGIKKITAILLSCSLVMTGCAVNPAHTPVNGQTGTASTVSAGRETDTETAAKTAGETAAETAGKTASETAADAATAASMTLPPAGREFITDKINCSRVRRLSLCLPARRLRRFLSAFSSLCLRR